MKILKFISFLALIILMSCGTTNSPEKTVKDFYSAIKEKQYDKAKQFVTEESKKGMDMVGANIELTLGGSNLTNIDCVTEGASSKCDCFLEGKDTPIPVSLIKQEEEWKIDLKSSLLDGFDNILDNLKGLDLNGLMDQLGDGIDMSSEGINDLIKNIDVDKAVETLKGLDSNLNETGGNLEELINQVTEGLEKSKK